MFGRKKINELERRVRDLENELRWERERPTAENALFAVPVKGAARHHMVKLSLIVDAIIKKLNLQYEPTKPGQVVVGCGRKL